MHLSSTVLRTNVTFLSLKQITLVRCLQLNQIQVQQGNICFLSSLAMQKVPRTFLPGLCLSRRDNGHMPGHSLHVCFQVYLLITVYAFLPRRTRCVVGVLHSVPCIVHSFLMQEPIDFIAVSIIRSQTFLKRSDIATWPVLCCLQITR